MRITTGMVFRVYGTPKAQPRVKARARGGFAAVYDPGTADGWKGHICVAAKPVVPSEPMQGPIRVDADFLFKRPGRLNRKKDPDGRIQHIDKPDRDNLEKALLDALTALGFWGDDCQVCAGEIRKWYCARGEAPGAIVAVTAAEKGENYED